MSPIMRPGELALYGKMIDIKDYTKHEQTHHYVCCSEPIQRQLYVQQSKYDASLTWNTAIHLRCF